MSILDSAKEAAQRLKFQFPYNIGDWVNNMDMLMENYHKHTTWSDLVQIDSATSMDANAIFLENMGIKESGCMSMIYAGRLKMKRLVKKCA